MYSLIRLIYLNKLILTMERSHRCEICRELTTTQLCSICNKHFCKECLIKCKICGKMVCLDNSMYCEVCGGQYCVNHQICRCSKCRLYMCKSCYDFTCEYCGKDYCIKCSEGSFSCQCCDMVYCRECIDAQLKQLKHR